MVDYNQRLRDLALDIPEPSAPAGLYTPWIKAGSLLHVAGQLSIGASGTYEGRVGPETDIGTAKAAARVCGLNLLSQIRAALGDLGRVRQVLKLNAFVCVAQGFNSIPAVADGCSQLFVDVFGEAGRHARVAVGVAELPRGAMVEVDAVLSIGPAATRGNASARTD